MYLYINFFCAAQKKIKQNAEGGKEFQRIYLNISLQEGRVFGIYIKSLLFKFSCVCEDGYG